jgi:hypothetical protein
VSENESVTSGQSLQDLGWEGNLDSQSGQIVAMNVFGSEIAAFWFGKSPRSGTVFVKDARAYLCRAHEVAWHGMTENYKKLVLLVVFACTLIEFCTSRRNLV